MTINEVIIALVIHLIIPLIGLVCFLLLMKQIKDKNIPKAPTVSLFLIFSTYGGLLLVILTDLFWKWSGMASIGTFYLIFVAPIVMGAIAFQYRLKRTISKYHNCIYLSSLLYFLIALITFVLIFLIAKN